MGGLPLEFARTFQSVLDIAAAPPTIVVRVERHAYRYLVIEDDALVARTLARYFEAFGEALVEPDVAGARARIERTPAWDGVIVDVGLPDGSGLDLLAELRRDGFRAPVLVLTGRNEPEVMAAAQLRRAFFLPKPPSPENLRSFVDETRNHREAVRNLLEDRIERLAARVNLTPREREILLLGTRGVPRGELAAHLGVEESTVKSAVRKLIRKTGHFTLADLVSAIHRSIFIEDG